MSTSEDIHEDVGRLRSVVRRTAVVAAVWAASVPVAEGAFRVAGVSVAGTTEGIYQSFGQEGYRLRPGLNALQNWASGSFRVRTDARGLRTGAGEASLDESPDILVLGDSQGFGQGLDFEDTVVGRLSGLAEAHGRTVVNASVGGYSVRDEVDLATWLLEAERIWPRTLLVCLTPRAMHRADAPAQVMLHDGEIWGGPPSASARLRKWLSAHSAVYVTVRDAVKRSSTAGTAADVLALYEPGEEADARTERVETCLAPLAERMRAMQGRIVIAYLPLAVEPRIAELAAAAGSSASAEVPAIAARKIASRLGVQYVDCAPGLESVRSRGVSVELRGDPHYGREASGAVAELLWSALSSD